MGHARDTRGQVRLKLDMEGDTMESILYFTLILRLNCINLKGKEKTLVFYRSSSPSQISLLYLSLNTSFQQCLLSLISSATEEMLDFNYPPIVKLILVQYAKREFFLTVIYLSKEVQTLPINRYE